MWVRMALVVLVEVTGVGRQVPVSCIEEHVAEFPLCSPKISTSTEYALCL